ncbi:acyloxyacyl hydrolase [Variovorax sp. J22P168]|uniref:acyloxyacyl hydrolase n=1 Tax=Variovorax jilinensis TaxID=3053513 RepID=UPI0025781917|nr:acyloxyacyl hydrolase [Variovorax sp. J22P168]MDM0014236.1 acyloxyacyl hydrolase [Variovorax sp. J22P168]
MVSAAPEDREPGVYIDLGQAPHSNADTDSLTLGVVVPWTRRQSVQGGALSFYWDFFISQWRAPRPDNMDKRSYTQIGAIANWRYRFNQGDSPWFAEAGVGATVMDSLYHTPDRDFSTTFQFTEVLGFGRNFGSQGEHELSLRLQHFSNAGIKKPNPGENFVRVRYLYRF